MRRRLYPVPNKSRTPWCFLVLRMNNTHNDTQIVGWEIVVGNSHQIVDRANMNGCGSIKESRLLAKLMDELKQYQQKQVILHTVSTEVLELLRARLLLINSDNSPSFRGFRHLSLRSLLAHFGPWWKNIVEQQIESEFPEDTNKITEVISTTDMTARDLWKIRQMVGPLLPIETLQGNPL